MTFEELERWAAAGTPPDGPVELWDRLCYSELLRLLGRFRAGELSQAGAAEEKTRLRVDWEKQKRLGELERESADKRRRAIARSEQLRAGLGRGIAAGRDERELLALALRCIGEMTGDFWMLEMAERYGAGALEMCAVTWWEP